MSLRDAQRDPAPVDAPVNPPKVVRQRRVRPGLLGLAVLLIALGGLGAAFAVTSVRATGSYLAVARPVEVGREISAADLVTVQVAGGQGLRPVPAGRLDEVVGKRAAVALLPGTLLTLATGHRRPAARPRPAADRARPRRPRQVPARELHPGDKVLLVSTPDAAPTRHRRRRPPGSRPPSSTWSAPATDDVVLYLALAARDVPAVVALAAQDRIAVVLTEAA